MFIENHVRHMVLIQDISIPEEEVRLSAMRCEGMNLFSIVKREHLQTGFVIADVDPRNWFKVIEGVPENIKDSLVNILMPTIVDKNSDSWLVMSIMTNHLLCPELEETAVEPYLPMCIDVSDMPTWLVFNTDPNSNACFNSYMQILSPVDSSDHEIELLFPSPFVQRRT